MSAMNRDQDEGGEHTDSEEHLEGPCNDKDLAVTLHPEALKIFRDFFEKVSEYPTVTQVSDLVKEVSHLPGCEHVDTEHLKRYFRRKRKNKRKRERKSGMEVNVVDATSQSDFCEEPEGVLENNNDRAHDAVSQKVYKILRDYSTNKSDMPDSSERKILMEEILKIHRSKFWTDKRLVKYFHNRRQTVRRRATCSLMRPEMDSCASEAGSAGHDIPASATVNATSSDDPLFGVQEAMRNQRSNQPNAPEEISGNTEIPKTYAQLAEWLRLQDEVLASVHAWMLNVETRQPP